MLKVIHFAALWLPCIAFHGDLNSSDNIESSTDVGREIRPACSDFLHSFANTTKQFNLCAVMHAKPLRFCEKCTMEYTDLLARDPVKYNNSMCVEDLVKSERFQIVMKVYDFQTGLWFSANCDECYNHRDTYNSTWDKTPDTKKFFKRLRALMNCFQNYSNGAVTNESQLCRHCLDSFNELRATYQKILKTVEDENEDKLCVDIMSAMNDTRNDWKRYNCWDKRENNYLVLSLTFLICFIAFIFYVGVRKHEKYRRKVQSRSHRAKKAVNYDSE